MNSDASSNEATLSWGERLLSLGAEIRPGEGKSAYLLMTSLFFLLITAYLLKPAREMLILTQGGSEIRSYSVALQAILLIVVIPIYGILVRKFDGRKFMLGITVFFATNMFCFYVLAKMGVQISIPFFVWLGVYGVLIVSQFWGFASQVYDKQRGERLFALVAVGASVGAWVGSILSRWLVTFFGPNELILMSIFTLLIAVAITTRLSADDFSGVSEEPKKAVSYWSGFSMVVKSRYLILIAIFVILLNWVNSTGEYLLSFLVEVFYEEGTAAGSITDSKETYIGKFYTEFYLMVNLVGVIIQFFVVSRLIKWAGFRPAFVITPILVFMGYGLLAFFPIVALFRVVKVAENGLDYSLQNTTRQILFLPTTRREKYEARAVIDTLCFRFGDLLQAGAVFIGLNVLYVLPRHFVFLNIFLALAMVIVGMYIGKYYLEKTSIEKPGESDSSRSDSITA